MHIFIHMHIPIYAHIYTHTHICVYVCVCITRTNTEILKVGMQEVSWKAGGGPGRLKPGFSLPIHPQILSHHQYSYEESNV